MPLSGLSSVPDPEWLPELDWLPADEGRASRPLSSSLAWLRSPPSELLSESLRADRDEEVLLVSLRGLLEFRPATQAATRIQRQGQKKKTTRSGLILKNAILRVLNMFVLHADTR